MLTAVETALEIRPLTGDDTRALADFFRVLAADPETCRFFHPHPLTEATAAELTTGSRRDRYYLARYRDRVVAYSMLRGWDEGYAVPSFGGCTHPELRGAGLGHALLAHAIAESRAAGAAHLRLTVYRDNRPAVHLYRKFGFRLLEKNEREWIGLLDLSAVLATMNRPLKRTVLDAWINGSP